MIDTGAGVIDADYRGIVNVLLFNLSDKDFQGESKPNPEDLTTSLSVLPQSKRVIAWPSSSSSEFIPRMLWKWRYVFALSVVFSVPYVSLPGPGRNIAWCGRIRLHGRTWCSVSRGVSL